MQNKSLLFFKNHWVSALLLGIVAVAVALLVRRYSTTEGIQAQMAPSPMQNASVSINPTTAGASGAVLTVSFTANSSGPVLGNNSSLQIDFPIQSDFALGSAMPMSCNDAVFPGPHSENSPKIGYLKYTLTSSGVVSMNPVSIICTINGITNASTAGQKSGFKLTLRDPTGFVMVEESQTLSVTLTSPQPPAPGDLSEASVVATNQATLVAGQSGNITVSFKAATPVANNGKVEVTFPEGFTLSDSITITSSSNLFVGSPITKSIAGLALTAIANGSGTINGIPGARAETFSMALGGVTLPSSPGPTGSFTIKTLNNSGTVIDQVSSVSGVNISAPPVQVGTLSNASVVPASLIAGAVGNVTASFSTINAVPNGGKVEIVFPSVFVLNSGASTAMSSGPSGFNLALTGSTVTLTGGSINAATAVTIVLTNIKNPTSAGQTGTFSVRTLQSNGTTEIDKNTTVAGVNIAAAPTHGAAQEQPVVQQQQTPQQQTPQQQTPQQQTPQQQAPQQQQTAPPSTDQQLKQIQDQLQNLSDNSSKTKSDTPIKKAAAPSTNKTQEPAEEEAALPDFSKLCIKELKIEQRNLTKEKREVLKSFKEEMLAAADDEEMRELKAELKKEQKRIKKAETEIRKILSLRKKKGDVKCKPVTRRKK